METKIGIAGQWVNERASAIATAKEEAGKASGQMVTLDWSKIFFQALLEYLDACGVCPERQLSEYEKKEFAEVVVHTLIERGMIVAKI